MALCLITSVHERTPTKHDLEGVPQPPKTSLELPGETPLALTMWGEARGESKEAMKKVGTVILNRVNHPDYPKTIEEVVKEPKQFSVWDKSNPNYRKMLTIRNLEEGSPDWEAYQEAKKLARELLTHGSKNHKWLFFSSHNGHTKAK